MQRLHASIPYDSQRLRAWCQRWHLRELAFFGSVLRPDFHADSDIDVLIEVDPQSPISLFDLADMERELRLLFGRPVHVAEKAGLNPWIGPDILAQRQIAYVPLQ